MHDVDPTIPSLTTSTADRARASWPRWQTAVFVAGGLGACAYLAIVDPNMSSAYPQCPLRALTGLDCAGCGGLRATHALLTGDVVRAADQNLLLVLSLPLIAYGLLRLLADRFGWNVPRVPWRPWMTVAAAVVVVGFSVVRNVAWGPGVYLNSFT